MVNVVGLNNTILVTSNWVTNNIVPNQNWTDTFFLLPIFLDFEFRPFYLLNQFFSFFFSKFILQSIWFSFSLFILFFVLFLDCNKFSKSGWIKKKKKKVKTSPSSIKVFFFLFFSFVFDLSEFFYSRHPRFNDHVDFMILSSMIWSLLNRCYCWFHLFNKMKICSSSINPMVISLFINIHIFLLTKFNSLTIPFRNCSCRLFL